MIRTIIFYTTLYIAAIMLAVDTGIKRSQELVEKCGFVKSALWGFTPLALLVMFGGLNIYSYLYPPTAILASGTTTAPASITDGKHWFRISDADKWNLALGVRALQDKDQPFRIYRYDTPECEDLGNDLEDVLEAAGWKPVARPSTGGEFKKGISLYAASFGAQRLQSLLSDSLHFTVGNPPSSQEWLQQLRTSNLIQIEIGNPPES